MNFYIFRHGETFSTVNSDSGYGDKQFTTGILPEGIPAIQRLAEYLKQITPDHAAASELLRVQETVKVVTKITGVEFVKDKRLNELLDENGMAPAPPYAPYFEIQKEQLKEFLQEMEKHNYKTVFICTHGYNIAGIKHLILNNSFEVKDLPNYPNPGVLTIIKGKEVEEIDFN